MKVTINAHNVVVERDGDEKVYSESLLLHRVKLELIRQGHNVIKKRMWKDGHMYGDDTTQYIRERAWKFAVYDGEYALRRLYEPYNDDGRVALMLEHLR